MDGMLCKAIRTNPAFVAILGLSYAFLWLLRWCRVDLGEAIRAAVVYVSLWMDGRCVRGDLLLATRDGRGEGCRLDQQ